MDKKKGEIATFLTVATLVFIGAASILTSSLVRQTKTTQTKAAGNNIWCCQADAICADAGVQASFIGSAGGNIDTAAANWRREHGTAVGKNCGDGGGSSSQPTPGNAGAGANTCANKPICIYSQQDANGVNCYEGNRLNDTYDSGFNVNCGWIAGCSSGRKVDCPGSGGGTSGGSTTAGSSGVAGCFHMEGDAKYLGSNKFDITIRFVSDGGDGDVKLDKDGAHVAGWNGWNKAATNGVWTWVPRWTGSPITVDTNITKTVTYRGMVANSAACPGVTATLPCYLSVTASGVDSGNCGGSSPSSSTTTSTTTTTTTGGQQRPGNSTAQPPPVVNPPQEQSKVTDTKSEAPYNPPSLQLFPENFNFSNSTLYVSAINCRKEKIHRLLFDNKTSQIKEEKTCTGSSLTWQIDAAFLKNYHIGQHTIELQYKNSPLSGYVPIDKKNFIISYPSSQTQKNNNQPVKSVWVGESAGQVMKEETVTVPNQINIPHCGSLIKQNKDTNTRLATICYEDT